MKHLFVSYEIANQLKEKRFDESCLAWYNTHGSFIWKFICADEESDFTVSVDEILESENIQFINIPMFDQVTAWFRDKKDIDITIMPVFREKCGYDSFKRDGWTFTILRINPCQYLTIAEFNQCAEDRDEQEKGEEYLTPSFKTYYEAINKAIEEAIKLI